MFDFTLNEELQMLRDMVKDFVNNELKPIAAKIDEDEEILIEDSGIIVQQWGLSGNLQEGLAYEF